MKSRHQRELAQQTLSREVGFVRKPHANRLRVALIFPNTYFVGMSNLGFQTIYRLFNDQPDIVCERAFLPPKQELAALRDSGTRIVTLESQTPVSDFDVIAFSVSRRTREIGVRMALGAQPQGVLGLVMRQGFALAGVGLIIGLVLAGAAGAALSGLLYGITPFDPLAWTLAVVTLLAAAALANLVPARRAMRVDPMAALRME